MVLVVALFILAMEISLIPISSMLHATIKIMVPLEVMQRHGKWFLSSIQSVTLLFLLTGLF